MSNLFEFRNKINKIISEILYSNKHLCYYPYRPQDLKMILEIILRDKISIKEWDAINFVKDEPDDSESSGFGQKMQSMSVLQPIYNPNWLYKPSGMPMDFIEIIKELTKDDFCAQMDRQTDKEYFYGFNEGWKKVYDFFKMGCDFDNLLIDIYTLMKNDNKNLPYGMGKYIIAK